MPTRTADAPYIRDGGLRFQPQEFWTAPSHNVASAPEGMWVTFVKVKVTNLGENGNALFRVGGQKMQASPVAVSADLRLSYGLPGDGLSAEILPGKSVYPVLAFATERKPSTPLRLTLSAFGGGGVDVPVHSNKELPLRAHPDRSGR